MFIRHSILSQVFGAGRYVVDQALVLNNVGVRRSYKTMGVEYQHLANYKHAFALFCFVLAWIGWIKMDVYMRCRLS